MLKLNNKNFSGNLMMNSFLYQKKDYLRAVFAAGIVSCLFSSSSLAQPNRGDLEIYETAIGTNNAGSNSVQPNLLFIADTSGSMDDYVAVEYQLTKDAYVPTFDYGGDGAAADDDYIYVYDDIETFSGVTITQAQNKCNALTTAHTNSPSFPLFSDKVLQWKPIMSTVEITPEVVCETGSTSPSSVNIPEQYNSTYWTEINFASSQTFFESDFVSGSSLTMQMYNDGPKHSKGGLWVAEMTSGGSYTGDGDWLCYRNKWNRYQTKTCTGDIDDISFNYYEVQVWFNGSSGDSYMSGTVTYNQDAPESQLDPDCVPADAVTAEVVSDGEWSGTLETNSDSDYILECEEDAGVHGISSVSSDDEAAFCGAASCTSPRYVASNGIDWSSEGLTDKYFYTGNYHDYLNYTPPVPGTLYDTRAGWYVRERYDHSDWDYAGSRSVESFCNLFDSYDRVASNSSDSSTWSPVIPHPIVAPDDIFLEDSNDGTSFVYICRQKQQTMINALTDMATSISGVNMGLMRFNSNGQGGTVISHVQNISDSTKRAALVSKIAALPASGGTPLSETMSEAYRYFNGGSKSYSGSNADSDAFTGAKNASPYESPITHSCQSNSIIYLTDGAPSVDSNGGAPAAVGCSGSNCMDEWAGYMADTDIHSIDGKNTVNTYTVGFAIDLPLLASTAEKGNGEYFTAENYDDLMTAFQEILLNIAISEPSTLVAPAVSVNAFNELKHRSQIYYATFTPAFNPAWEGNVKRYAITGEGVVYGQAGTGTPVIGDDGFFKSSAQSFWSDFPDGANVEQGGYREQLTNTRNVYLESSVLNSGSGIVKIDGSSSLKNTAFGVANTPEADQLRDWLLGIDIDDYDGDTSFVDAHRYASDSLHSKPFVVTYSGTSEADAEDILFVSTNMGSLSAIDARSAEGTELWTFIPKELVGNVKKYRDNSASLRHWNAYGLDGEATVWAEEAAGSTASNFDIGKVYMFQGMRRGGDRYYAWDISNADADLTSGTVPIRDLWSSIKGGVGGGATPGFSDLGYTWSKMIRTKVRYSCTTASTNTGCTEKDVLVFSGGYDAHYDTASSVANSGSETTDILGNAVYVVDALTGALLWSTGSSASADTHDLNLPIYNSIPGDPSPLDVDGDGDMDMLFFIDISGMVYRVDFDQSNAINGSGSNAYATGGVIADLTDATNPRRFYNGLDISLNASVGDTSYLAISVGSGYRAHPKAEEAFKNRFYVLIDENVQGPEIDDKGTEDTDDDEPTYKYVKSYDTDGNITSRNIIKQSHLHAYSGGDPFDRGVDSDYGFYRSFDDTKFEKILQTSVSFNGDILVASYLPVARDNVTATCGSGQIGSGRVYKFSIETGIGAFAEPDPNDNSADNVIDADGDGYGDYIELDHEGIPPDPTILLVPELVTCIGTECSDDWLDVETGRAERTYWREN